MQVQISNSKKIYNLSAGKSVPEWISARKRRLLEKKDVDIRQRINLIQDFEMPVVCTGVKMSKDGKYVLATGVYKPRIRCYDVSELALKFERCFNAEAVEFLLLENDYSKIVLLQCDRNVEFHVQHGCHYRTRIPKHGRDMAYHVASCDLYLVGASSEVYRLNLEEGKFLNSLQTNASSINKICINPVHDLVTCGTAEGRIEAWDPRDRKRVGILDCALSAVTETTNVTGLPSVTALKFKDGLTMAVGMSTGQVLLYDIRANKPFTVKDHMYDRPIKCVDFIGNEGLVASLDDMICKIWEERTGKPYVAIQANANFNDMCIVPNSGLFFFAVEDTKIQTFYVPSIGHAPKWCYFLDRMTEELEETRTPTVYDDYKFVTTKDLEDLGLSHLIGTNLLRGYMHGFFMDIRLYNKAKAIVQPSAFKDLKKKKIQEKIEMERKNRVMMTKKLPAVNKELAKLLMEQSMAEKTQKQPTITLLQNDRFEAMFNDEDFAVDEVAEEYDQLKMHLNKTKKLIEKKKKVLTIHDEQFEAVQEEEQNSEYTSSEESDDEDEESLNSEPEEQVELKQSTSNVKQPKLYEIKDSENFTMFKKNEDTEMDTSLPLEERLRLVTEKSLVHKETAGGEKVVTFSLKKSESQKKREEENAHHIKERAKYRRPAKNLRK